MIYAAGGVSMLAAAIGIGPRRLRRVFTGTGSLSGGRAELSRLFASEHGLLTRIFVHPSERDCYLISSPDGWWSARRAPRSWPSRVPSHRPTSDDWSFLPQLEVDFASAWDVIGL